MNREVILNLIRSKDCDYSKVREWVNTASIDELDVGFDPRLGSNLVPLINLECQTDEFSSLDSDNIAFRVFLSNPNPLFGCYAAVAYPHRGIEKYEIECIERVEKTVVKPDDLVDKREGWKRYVRAVYANLVRRQEELIMTLELIRSRGGQVLQSWIDRAKAPIIGFEDLESRKVLDVLSRYQCPPPDWTMETIREALKRGEYECLSEMRIPFTSEIERLVLDSHPSDAYDYQEACAKSREEDPLKYFFDPHAPIPDIVKWLQREQLLTFNLERFYKHLSEEGRARVVRGD
jgi:hypothetical protein